MQWWTGFRRSLERWHETHFELFLFNQVQLLDVAVVALPFRSHRRCRADRYRRIRSLCFDFLPSRTHTPLTHIHDTQHDALLRLLLLSFQKHTLTHTHTKTHSGTSENTIVYTLTRRSNHSPHRSKQIRTERQPNEINQINNKNWQLFFLLPNCSFLLSTGAVVTAWVGGPMSSFRFLIGCALFEYVLLIDCGTFAFGQND